MTRFATHYAFLILLLWSTSSRADIILFDEFSIGTEVDDEYLNVGLMFSTSGVSPAEIVDLTCATCDANIGSPAIVTASSTGLRILPPSASDILSVTFVDPVDQTTPAFVTSASFSFVSDAAGANYGQLRAFDEFDSQVDFQISSVGGVVGGNQGYETLSVSGPKIMRLEIDGFDTDVIIDTLEFTTPTGVPEPSTLLLASLAGCVLLRRRRRF